MTTTDDLKRILTLVYRNDPTCEATVTRDWEQDECGKPATSVVRGTWEGEQVTFPTCAYHAHMAGLGAALTLAEILRSVSK